MAKLPRVTNKRFGANANVANVGQFGSAAAGTKTNTKDVATIQALSAWEDGWTKATMSHNKYPTMQERNGLDYVHAYQIDYLLKSGIPEYDSQTEYNIGDIVKHISGDAVTLYQSIIDGNIGQSLGNALAWNELRLGGSRNIGEIIASSVPLNDAGLHLLDGTRLSGSGSYGAFVDHIANLYNNATSKWANVTKVGTITDADGVLSGFSSSDYAQAPINFVPGAYTWEMVFKITTPNSFTAWNDIAGAKGSGSADGLSIGINNSTNKFSLAVYNSSWQGTTGSYTVLANTTYWLKIEYTGSAYTLSYSTDGTNYTPDITVTSTTTLTTKIHLGCVGGGGNYFEGSIDLNESYINLDGSRWWTGRLPYAFTDEAHWQNTNTAYGVCGKFVYDSVNNTVRLPKITGFVEGTTDLTALGDVVPAGLPQHAHSGTTAPAGAHAHGTNGSSSNDDGGGVFTSGNTVTHGGLATQAVGDHVHTFTTGNASNAIYGNSNTVQPQAIKVFYYIVVATAVKTDIEVDIDEIATDLNGKADTDLSNISQSAQALLNKITTYPKIYFANGMLINAYQDSTAGYAVAEVVLYSDGIAEIHFNGEITTAGTNSSIFTWGLNRDLLRNANINIPLISPISGGSVVYYTSTGFDAGRTAYGGMMAPNLQFWDPARQYNSSGSLGAWPASAFPTGYHMAGVCYGTYTVGTEG